MARPGRNLPLPFRWIARATGLLLAAAAVATLLGACARQPALLSLPAAPAPVRDAPAPAHAAPAASASPSGQAARDTHSRHRPAGGHAPAKVAPPVPPPDPEGPPPEGSDCNCGS
jgi:hypothetical protein